MKNKLPNNIYKRNSLQGLSSTTVNIENSEVLDIFGVNNENIDFLWTRIFYLYGEDEDERRLVAVLRKKLALGEPVDLTSGNQIRDFLDVKIAGSMIAKAAIGRNVGPFNVCSGEGQSIRELAENIAEEYGWWIHKVDR